MPPPRRGSLRQAGRAARRAWPYMLMAWERWQALSPEDKARYRRRARDVGERGRRAVDRRRRG